MTDDSLESSIITTLDSWRAFISHVPQVPTIMAKEQIAQLSADQRAEYDEDRSYYHSELPSLQTPMLHHVVNEGRSFVLLNRGHQGGTPCGMVISGPSGIGKSTALRELGRVIELGYRRRNPGMPEAVPVVYITMPPGRHPRALPAELLYFLGAPHGRRDSETTLTHQACQLMIDLRTRIVIIDEIHKLDRSKSGHNDQSDQLKYFMEHIPATFVLAGIAVEKCGFFTGQRGQQLARRFTTIQARPFAITTLDQRREWERLVEGFEQRLRLQHHGPGTLPKMADYLYGRTGGYITSLSHLIRRAAIKAIEDDTERITRKHLDLITLDHAATKENDAPKKRKQPKPAPVVKTS